MVKSNHPAKTSLSILCLVAFLFSSCGSNTKKDADKYLARVGQEYLTITEAKEAIPDFVVKEDSLNALKWYREEWVKNQLLLQEARRLELEQKEEVRKKINEARKEILRQALKDYIVGSFSAEDSVSDQEARSYYQAHQSDFTLNEEFVRFRHMRAKTLNDARAAKRDLLYAVPWPEVAQKYAVDPQAVIKESKQFWPLSMAANNIDIMNRYLHVIGQKEISPIQRVDGEYHFVQLMESHAKGELPNLKWLMEQIKDWMLLNKRRHHFKSYLKNLYLKAKSNNEVETFNVLNVNPNQKSTVPDTLEINSTDE